MAAATSTPPQQPPAGLSRWIPSLPTINLNSLNPFANAEEEKRQSSEQTRQKDDASRLSPVKNRTLLSTFTLGSIQSSSSRDTSPTRSNAEGSIMFAEPDRSEDGDSLEHSVLDSGRRSSRLRSNKPKTCYSVCHAPNASRARNMHRRPRSLLQLHRLSPNARPVPAFEVISQANFNVRLTKDITRVFRAKHGLCPNDFVVLRAETYTTADEAETGQEAQDIIGLICNRRKDNNKDEPSSSHPMEKAKAKICMASGAEWEACSLPTGGYEFFTTDSHGLGLKVRWVPKKEKDGSKATTKDGCQRFNFSTISANSRRHPVIAVLSNKEMEVYDAYRVPDINVTPTPTPQRTSNSALTDAMEDEGASLQDQRETDDALREVITMTAIWVTFKEGWSPTFKAVYSKDKDAVTGAGSRAVSIVSVPNSPSKSALGLTTPPASPLKANLEKRNSIKSVGSDVLRRSSLLGRKGNRSSHASVPEEDLREAGLGRSESVKKAGRARGDSTSTVLVHRAASNRRRNNTNSQATWRPDLLQAQQHPLNETSRENSLAMLPVQQAQRKEAWESPDATTAPVGQIRDDVARPLIPNVVETPDTAAGTSIPVPVPVSSTPVVQPTLRPSTPVPPEKRVSDATTVTGSSIPERSAKMAKGGKSGKRKGGWRRLLCGGGNDI
ncbi:hypothetical protein LTS01_021841 [Friedmanniomyces endolithicus]|uniref:Uncharacterized protein n=1 Tax=Friedmanniomyces endolithicus TaxID=329885 RepID=A0AAN6F8M1_9PEZI|nr:hypothetical protein LTR82_017092 [Friedmanniomyces endolithicus]KAK0958534.1 hypothetical protein LTS01_021841 [Friedmanniomyces endolithicus]